MSTLPSPSGLGGRALAATTQPPSTVRFEAPVGPPMEPGPVPESGMGIPTRSTPRTTTFSARRRRPRALAWPASLPRCAPMHPTPLLRDDEPPSATATMRPWRTSSRPLASARTAPPAPPARAARPRVRAAAHPAALAAGGSSTTSSTCRARLMIWRSGRATSRRSSRSCSRSSTRAARRGCPALTAVGLDKFINVVDPDGDMYVDLEQVRGLFFYGEGARMGGADADGGGQCMFFAGDPGAVDRRLGGARRRLRPRRSASTPGPRPRQAQCCGPQSSHVQRRLGAGDAGAVEDVAVLGVVKTHSGCRRTAPCLIRCTAPTARCRSARTPARTTLSSPTTAMAATTAAPTATSTSAAKWAPTAATAGLGAQRLRRRRRRRLRRPRRRRRRPLPGRRANSPSSLRRTRTGTDGTSSASTSSSATAAAGWSSSSRARRTPTLAATRSRTSPTAPSTGRRRCSPISCSRRSC